MPTFTTPAILLRRVQFGDNDLIITLFTLNNGKISAIAKSAKKSVKRFSGILELFYILQVVCRPGRGRGMPVLQEASLLKPFSGIRSGIRQTAYASYWAELIYLWLEEEQKQAPLFHLLSHVLTALDAGQIPDQALSLLFQMRFLTLSGLGPNLKTCSACHQDIEQMRQNRVVFDLKRGGLVCNPCAAGGLGQVYLSKGTIKQLQWVDCEDLEKAQRIRFTHLAVKEGLEFLEAFVPFHLGKKPRSLTFLQQIRSSAVGGAAHFGGQ